MHELTAEVFDIKRMAIHDGDGIRTTVFFKGCPLHCLWCHNPEGIKREPQVLFSERKCIGCKECLRVCERGAHFFDQYSHRFDREKCDLCGNCVQMCPVAAVLLCGRKVVISDVLNEVLKDREYYRASNGGVTLSGGECLLQADFCAALLLSLKAEGINTAIDTCGCVQTTEIDKVLPFTDMFLYDIKHMDSYVHRYYTGTGNELILSNLRHIDASGKTIEIRIPVIPGINDLDSNMEETAEFLSTLNNVRGVSLLPYNNLIGSKYNMVGQSLKMPPTQPPGEERIKEIADIFRRHHIDIVE